MVFHSKLLSKSVPGPPDPCPPLQWWCHHQVASEQGTGALPEPHSTCRHSRHPSVLIMQPISFSKHAPIINIYFFIIFMHVLLWSATTISSECKAISKTLAFLVIILTDLFGLVIFLLKLCPIKSHFLGVSFFEWSALTPISSFFAEMFLNHSSIFFLQGWS